MEWRATPPANGPLREGIFSLLDTDLYKLTMQCAVLKYFPHVPVAYRFTNRTPHMKLNKAAYQWLQQQILRLGNINVTPEELVWLRRTCPYLSDAYLRFLETFKLRPQEHVTLIFKPSDGVTNDDATGDIELTVRGLWKETILYEIPLLALVSECYFKFMDTDWTYDQQVERAKDKALRLLEAGCVFSEFGSRRRRDYHTHELVMEGLVQGQDEALNAHPDWTGKLTGTSNVHFAMRFGLSPVGTVAHEWFMGIAAVTNDYANANERAMQYWIGAFGPGVLGIALTDTFGTKAFLRAFAKPARSIEHSANNIKRDEHAPTYAEIFVGVRQDSGDPLAYLQIIRSFYAEQNIKAMKVIVFSDSLNVEKCIEYKRATEDAGLTSNFGVGTFFSNDFRRASAPDVKSPPMNIVIKLSEAADTPAAKLSDDVGKNMGDDALVARIKREVSYEGKQWGDEARRWD